MDTRPSGGPATLEVRLACPACPSDPLLVNEAPDAALCTSCGTAYPILACGEARIPWLTAHPEAVRREWSARYRGFLLAITNEHNRLNRALSDPRLTAAARRRIAAAVAAKRAHRQQIIDLLAPARLDGEDMVPAMTNVLASRLPRNRHVAHYAARLFRDWAWGNGENEALLDGVEAVLAADPRQSAGAVLSLGAAGCRLPYDFHRRFLPDLSVALDVNPLLLLVAALVVQGRDVSLHEFAQAPLDEHCAAVLHACRAPAALDSGVDGEFRFVLGDVTRPPFSPASFDTVLTPWLTDILPGDVQDFIPEVNRLLPQGGVWVNAGSLAFMDDDPRRCYSEAEVLERVEDCGFEILTVDRREIPWLCSPHSARGRIERIASFAAIKRYDVEAPRAAAFLPEWILDPTRPVPSSTEAVLASSSHLLLAQVWAAIDGKRSIAAISRLVSREYGLSPEECMDALQRVLADAWARGGRLDTL